MFSRSKQPDGGMTNVGVGNAILVTRVKLTALAVANCLYYGAIPCFVLPYAVWYHSASQREIDVVRFHAVAAVVNPEKARRWRITGELNNDADPSDERRIVTLDLANGTSTQWMKPVLARAVFARWDAVMTSFRKTAYISFATGLVGFLGVWYFLSGFGRRSQADKRVRGAKDIVTVEELNTAVRVQMREEKTPSVYKLVDVLLPQKAPMRGILALGSQGSGKSMAIHDLMLQVFARRRKCIVYDQSGEFFRAHFRPGKDQFFNPACLGSVPWSIFSEMTHDYNADTLAQAFLPPKAGQSGTGAFFEDAARALFSVLLLRLTKLGAKNTCDLARAFLTLEDEVMDDLIKGTVASSAVGGDSKAQRQGVISSIAIYLNGIDAVQPGNWSIRDFIDGPEDARLYILGSSDTRAMFAPLFRLLLTVAFQAIAAQTEEVHGDRYWFFLDEVHTLGDIKLDEQLATLRKNGVCVVGGVQSDSQFIESMGKDRAATVMNGFNSILMLGANEENMQKRMSARLGMVDVDSVSRNQALAVTESRDGAGLTRMDKEKSLVMPAHFGELDPCQGYVKTIGSFPAAEVDYRHWLRGSAIFGKRADQWRPRHDLPPKDPKFQIFPERTDDVMASIQAVHGEASGTATAPGRNSSGVREAIDADGVIAEHPPRRTVGLIDVEDSVSDGTVSGAGPAKRKTGASIPQAADSGPTLARKPALLNFDSVPSQLADPEKQDHRLTHLVPAPEPSELEPTRQLEQSK